MVIGPNGEKLGLKQINDALTLASYSGFDLVLISQSSNPPVCKLMDYNRFRYESQKRSKENLKKQREGNLEMKEYRLSVTIDTNDFNTRVNNAKKYLQKGHKIKGSIRFKGRQLAHPELGNDVLLQFAKALEEISVIEKNPILDNKSMSIILTPKKEK